MRWGIAFDNTYPPVAGPGQSSFDTFSDCHIGFQNWVGGSGVTGGFTQHCTQYNMLLNGPTHVSDTVVKVQRSSDEAPDIIGVYMGGPWCSFKGGGIYLNNYFPTSGHNNPAGSTGIVVNNYAADINTYIEANDASGHNDQIGVRIKNSTPTKSSRIIVRLTGFKNTGCVGVKVDNGGLGNNNEIRIIASEADGLYNTWNNSSDKRLQIASGWDSSNRIYINEHQLTAGQQYPP
jgi:hypothetical protein